MSLYDWQRQLTLAYRLGPTGGALNEGKLKQKSIIFQGERHFQGRF